MLANSRAELARIFRGRARFVAPLSLFSHRCICGKAEPRLRVFISGSQLTQQFTLASCSANQIVSAIQTCLCLQHYSFTLILENFTSHFRIDKQS